MRIELTVDGKYLALSVSSDKPLDLLLQEDVEVRNLRDHCDGSMCGRCIVLLDDKAVFSCLTPAFMVRGRTVTTFDGFQRTRDYRDIEKAFASCHIRPCERCLPARVMLIESIVRRYETGTGEPQDAEVLQEAGLVRCHCLDSAAFLAVVREALANRRKRKNVRRTKIS